MMKVRNLGRKSLEEVIRQAGGYGSPLGEVGRVIFGHCNLNCCGGTITAPPLYFNLEVNSHG